MGSQDVSAAIVSIQREARFAGVTPDQWAERLRNFAAAQPGVGPDVTIHHVRPVGTAAGGSNGTLLFDAVYGDAGGRIRRQLVLRFLPTDGLFHRYDVRGQYEIQRVLANTDVPVPPQVWLDETGSYLDRPGYVMEQVRGESTPMAWMRSGIIADATPIERRKMTTAYVEQLAKIHRLDWGALGLDWLKGRASGDRPIEREVNWYWDALEWAAVAWPAAGEYVDALAATRAWLIANEPDDVDIVLCHGDANLGNYMFEGTDVTAVVDWEMAFLGTPECDMTFMKTGDLILQPDDERPEGCLRFDEACTEYERISGRQLKHLDYFDPLHGIPTRCHQCVGDEALSVGCARRLHAHPRARAENLPRTCGAAWRARRSNRTRIPERN